ncbi:MAG: hypothetical protein ACTS3T_23490 [Almyronema sp.]
MQTHALEPQPSPKATGDRAQLASRPFSAIASPQTASGAPPPATTLPPLSLPAAAALDPQAHLAHVKQFGFDPMQVSLFAGGNPPVQLHPFKPLTIQRQQAEPEQTADMTFTLDELEAGETADLAEQPTWAEQFPDGISLTLSLRPDPAEMADHATRLQTMTWDQVLSRYQGRIGRNPRFQRAVALFRARQSSATASESSDPLSPNAAEAQLIGQALYQNDREFSTQAIPHAQSRRSIGGTARELEVGVPIFFTQAEDPMAKVRSVSAAVSEQSVERCLERPANIRELAIFTHGTQQHMSLGTQGSASGSTIAGLLADYLTPHVQIQLYGCSAAGGEDSFAEQLATTLAEHGHSARVFGHTTPKHTTRNPDGREFVATPEGAEGVQVSEADTWAACFTPAFLAAETTRLAAALSVDEAEVAGVMEPVSSGWLYGGSGRRAALQRVLLDGQMAAYTLGFERDRTLQELRAFWQQPAEGLDVIQQRLRRSARRRRTRTRE